MNETTKEMLCKEVEKIIGRFEIVAIKHEMHEGNKIISEGILFNPNQNTIDNNIGYIKNIIKSGKTIEINNIIDFNYILVTELKENTNRYYQFYYKI